MRNRELDGSDDAVVPLDQSFLGAVAGGLNPQPEPPGIRDPFLPNVVMGCGLSRAVNTRSVSRLPQFDFSGTAA
jgi:hypothetical protein